MLYATLTAWGMHRMGGADKTRSKLTEWDAFRESLASGSAALSSLRHVTLLGSSERDRSNSAMAPRMCNCSLPDGVVASMLSLGSEGACTASESGGYVNSRAAGERRPR